MNEVLISHPHAAAFATGTAVELERNGRLGVYFTGMAAAPGTLKGRAVALLGRHRPTVRNRILEGIPDGKLSPLDAVEGGARVLGRLARALERGPSTYDALFVGHDAAVAALPWPRSVRRVYAYEDGALRTFRRAARLGLERIWDLPIPHYATLQRMFEAEARRWPGAATVIPRPHPTWKRERKDEELALATLVSVPSAFTRESLENAGVTKPIEVIPFGFPVEHFTPKAKLEEKPFTVIAVGTQNLRKGTPYLLEAWKRAGIRDARLVLVGGMQLSSAFLRGYQGLFEHVPHVPRALLGDVYRSADLLVLATLGDGCPLVVQEAMCCGTPVLTTRCGNGPEFVANGVEGWVAPERDIDALVDRLREAAANRDRLFLMGRSARKRAESWSWREAGARLAGVLDSRDAS